jgi:hypothetical protein
MRLTIKDPTGRVIQTYVWPTADLAVRLNGVERSVGHANPNAIESGDLLNASAGDLSLKISRATGLLISVSRDGKSFSLANGPRALITGPRPAPARKQNAPLPPSQAPAFAQDSNLKSLTHEVVGEDLVVTATFDGVLKSLVYRLKPNGWLSIDYAYELSGAREYFGIGFDYPETNVKGMRFLGNGPAPVYQDRLAGGTLDVWNRPYNNTMDGDPDDLKPGERFNYPLFKGFYSDVRWLQLNTSEGQITAVVDQVPESPIYVQVFTPKSAPANLEGQVAVPFPTSGVSFLNAIPAIGNKFGAPTSMGPMGQPAIAKGDYKGHISLYFGRLPRR